MEMEIAVLSVFIFSGFWCVVEGGREKSLLSEKPFYMY